MIKTFARRIANGLVSAEMLEELFTLETCAKMPAAYLKPVHSALFDRYMTIRARCAHLATFRKNYDENGKPIGELLAELKFANRHAILFVNVLTADQPENKKPHK